MHRVVCSIVHYLVLQGAVDEEDYEVYMYGVQTGLEMLLCIAAGSVMAAGLGLLWEYVVFMSIFCPLRAYAGGIHLRHFATCFVCSCLVIFLILLCVEYYKPMVYAAFIITNIVVAVISCLGDMATAEWVKDSDEKAYVAERRKKIIISAVLLNFAALLFHCEKIVSILMYTVIVVLGSMLLEIIKYRFACGKDNK